MQRAQLGQKHKLSLAGSTRIPNSKKRIKIEQPVPPKVNSVPAKLESDSSDYSHPSEDLKPPLLPAPEQKPFIPEVKTEPLDPFEMKQPPQSLM